jgi:acetylornithine deacetylase
MVMAVAKSTVEDLAAEEFLAEEFAELVGFIAAYLASHGIACQRITGPEGDRDNLFATIGPRGRAGYILSAHLDVVPAAEPGWHADPFVLRRDGDRLIGRGACDMKGFVAAILAMVPALAAADLSSPVHIALSYDEEAGCRGVQHLLARLPQLCAPPAACIVGEPSGLQPILAHKGKAAIRLIAAGRAAHSSRPDLGVNAIHALLPCLNAVALQAEALAGSGRSDARFAPAYSTVQLGTMQGGQAINIVPDHARAEVEARAIAGEDPMALLAPVIAAAQRSGVRVEDISAYPPLALPADHPLATLCQQISGREPLGAVSYGTEAGLYQAAGVPAIICGPGDIARAHRPEEYLLRSELAETLKMLRRLMLRLSQ